MLNILHCMPASLLPSFPIVNFWDYHGMIVKPRKMMPLGKWTPALYMNSIKFFFNLYFLLQSSVQSTFHLLFMSSLSPLFCDSFSVFLCLCVPKETPWIVLAAWQGLQTTWFGPILLPWLCLCHWFLDCNIKHGTQESYDIPGDVNLHHLVEGCPPGSPLHTTSPCFPSSDS